MARRLSKQMLLKKNRRSKRKSARSKRKSVRSKRKSVRSKRKSVRRSKRRSRKSRKPLKYYETKCKVPRSKTNTRGDLIKEIRAYVRCHERLTTINQDLPMSRLRGETIPELKSHLKFYRNYNK
jgi:hypothetical protein